MYDDPDDAASYYRELERENQRCRAYIMELEDERTLAIKALRDTRREVEAMAQQLAKLQQNRAA